MARAPQRTYGEVEGLVTMLLAACEDPGMNDTLEKILSQPDHRRKAMVRQILESFRRRKAPRELHEAFVCLLDDDVAEKAYAAIFQCRREGKP